MKYLLLCGLLVSGCNGYEMKRNCGQRILPWLPIEVVCP